MPSIAITLTHRADTGRLDDWLAEADNLRPGIGKTWSDAISSLFRANLPAFGVASLRTMDQFNTDNPDVTWTDKSAETSLCD